MNRKIIVITLLCGLCLTGCGSNNESMYIIDKKPVVVEQSTQQGYGNVEAQVDSNADTDKELGTKHVVIIDGIPYAELDGTEHPGVNDKVNAPQEGNADIDNIKNAADSIKNKDKVEESDQSEGPEKATENTGEQSDKSDEADEFSSVIIRFADIAKTNEFSEEHKSRDEINTIAKKYGVHFDPKDKCQELAIACDLENVEVFALGTYKSEKDLVVGLASSKRTLNMINNIEVIESTNDRYYATISDGTKTSYVDILAINHNGEHYILEAVYMAEDDIAPKIFSNIQSDLEVE